MDAYKDFVTNLVQKIAEQLIPRWQENSLVQMGARDVDSAKLAATFGQVRPKLVEYQLHLVDYFAHKSVIDTLNIVELHPAKVARIHARRT